MITTDFTEMIGIRYPIIGAPMFLVSYEELVVAVSEAGGLGTFPVPNYLTVDDLKDALGTITSQTSKPIGVNIQLHGRYPWQEQFKICMDAGVKFFITALGNPRLIVGDVHANGGKVFASVISAEQAVKSAQNGVDGLIAIGAGAGGHGGTISTLVLVPYLKSLLGLPVVAAGGIANGAQMAAALAIGASAVEVGTRLIATPEARSAPEYKEMVLAAKPEDIVYSDRVTGYHANWIKESLDKHSAETFVEARWRKVWSAGHSVAQVKEIKPARDVIKEIVDDFYASCQRLRQCVKMN